jgi:hypothetical protein
VDQELREIHTAWLQRKDEEEERDAKKTQGCEVRRRTRRRWPPRSLQRLKLPSLPSPRISLPIRSTSDFLPPSCKISSFPPSCLASDSSSETFVSVPAGTISSPTLSISTVSDLTSTEFGEEIEYSKEQTTTCHDTFYFEDGNVEIVCGHTLFRVHSTVISFSSPNSETSFLRLALLHAPTPEGRPRITISESAEDFGILLKMIYTPGWDSSSFAVSSANLTV